MEATTTKLKDLIALANKAGWPVRATLYRHQQAAFENFVWNLEVEIAGSTYAIITQRKAVKKFKTLDSAYKCMHDLGIYIGINALYMNPNTNEENF